MMKRNLMEMVMLLVLVSLCFCGTASAAYQAVVDGQYTGTDGAVQENVKTYKTVTAALAEAPADSKEPYVIFIKNGRYYEKLTIDKPMITLIGEDRDKTILTYDHASGTKKPDGNSTYGTSGSASVTVKAADFHAENVTFENGFDYPANQAKMDSDTTKLAAAQAVALKTDAGSNRTFFKNCKFIGYQDTLYPNAGTHYFKQCYISGHVDFIFGAGQAVFDDCDIISRDRKSDNNGYITAASTLLENEFGFLFLNCRLKKETPEMKKSSVSLGRPWHPTTNLPDGTRAANPNAVGSVVFKNCEMDDHITTKGWEAMSGKDKDGNTIWFTPEKDARFAEYGSTGPGAIVSPTRKVLSDEEAAKYTVANVLGGWEPEK